MRVPRPAATPAAAPVGALDLAERVIASAGRDRPADARLREELKRARGLTPGAAAEASRAVFSYYRWRGWLDLREPVARQLRQALELAVRFAAQPQSFPDAEILARAVPQWILDCLAVTASWARSLQQEPRIWVRARPGQGRMLTRKIGRCHPYGAGALADCLHYDGQNDLFLTPEFHAGEFEIQDIASQAVGLVCAPRPGETWWDACAGEGGKTLHLSDLMGNQGLIWASDRADWRLRRLKRRAARARVFNYRGALWDGGAKLPTRGQFDGILVDAPCSGLGTWQRNPHARWTLTATDVAELAALQTQLLCHAATALKPGGRLIYATCTLTEPETEGVVRSFESKAANLEPLVFHHPLTGNTLQQNRCVFWPQDFQGNGMFIAAWHRAIPR